MVRRWERDATTNILTGRVTDSDTLAATTGNEFFLDSALRLIAANAVLQAGDTFDDTTYTPRAGLSGAALRDARRTELARRILEWASDSKLFNAINAKENVRAVGFTRILEAHTRAILVNANLENDVRYGIIRDELAKNPDRFIWKFMLSRWYAPPSGGVYGPHITGTGQNLWVYQTSGDIDANDTADNVDPAASAGVTMLQTATDWVSEIAKLSGA